jgi:5-methyltetrahydrofolate--homocysteine methyltransferase
MNSFIERINNGEVLIADGATGTNLQAMGLKAGTPPEELVMDHPDILLTLAEMFVDAGSDIILTCTFGGTSLRMKDTKYANKTSEVNLRATEIARKAAGKRAGVFVAGSMGPTGLLLKPYGPLHPEVAYDNYLEQASALVDGGVDLLVIETMFALAEADAAYDAARAVTSLPIVVSFSYDRGIRTMMGVKPTDMIRHYIDKGVDIVGANCGTSLENMEKVVQEYYSIEMQRPLWIKPNAGLPHMEAGSTKSTYDVTPEMMAASILKFISSGAKIVGGCCGTTPAHVADIVKAIKS